MFKEINYSELNWNPMTGFGTDWMALTAGNEKNGYNTMTVAWGQIGSIWGREGLNHAMPTAVCYVRPQRYTKKFMDTEEYFTLSAFPKEYKKALGYIGSHSGKDSDKVSEAGLTPVFADNTTYFEEANMVLICRTLYQAPLKEEYFKDHAVVDRDYPGKDFHDMYIGEIVKVLVKD